MIKAGIIGDYDPTYFNHVNTNNALHHAAKFLSRSIDIQWLPTDKIVREELKQFDLLWCAPGSPYKNMEGALAGIQFARENNVPFIGTCGGFQHTVLEYARNVMGIRDAEHAESNPDAQTLFITPLVCPVKGQTLEVMIDENSKAYKYCNDQKAISEQYYCNYGLNPEYQSTLEQNGLKVSGIDKDNEARILELPGNDFFIATLFIPQSHSTETHPHALIVHLAEAAVAFHKKRSVGKM